MYAFQLFLEVLPYYTEEVLKKILACSVSSEMVVIALFTCPCLKDQFGLCLINCNIHAITGNCSASLRVLAYSLRVVSAMTGSPPLLSDVQLLPPNSSSFTIVSCNKCGNVSCMSGKYRIFFGLASSPSHPERTKQTRENLGYNYNWQFSLTHLTP